MSNKTVDKSYASESNDCKNLINDLIQEVIDLRNSLKEMKEEIIEDMNEVTGLLIDHFKQVIAKQLEGDQTIDFDLQLIPSPTSSESGIESEDNSQELNTNQSEKSGRNREEFDDQIIEKTKL
jgi:hypothetical protein